MRMRTVCVSIVVVLLGLALTLTVSARITGNPEPPSPPDSTYSYTLEDIYSRLDTGAAGTPISFTEPSSGPGAGTGHTLDEVMAVAPAGDDVGGAVPSEVLSGTTYWSLRTAGTWGPQIGVMPDNGSVLILPMTVSQTIALGYHDGSGYVEGDTDLVSGNIASGVDIFGVSGALHGGCTCEGTLNGTRWCDNLDGTVTDLTTCLVWLQDANCTDSLAGIDKSSGQLDWNDAIVWSSVVRNGDCGLSDGSMEGDWWLPTKTQLYVLTHGTEQVRSDTPRAFTGVQLYAYWSSTTVADKPTGAWYVHLDDGGVGASSWDHYYHVWPVRGGQ
jgi:hypothetical protein